MFPYLEEYGVSCEFVEIPSSGDFTSKISFAFNILKQAIQHDVVFIQKTLFPPWFLKLINKLVDGIIFDYDDAVYTSPPKKNGGRPVLLNDNLANVNVVIAGSPILSTYAKTHASKVYCLPTSIPKEEYKKWTPRQRKNTSRLGWIGNPENLIYIDMVAAVLERILDNYPELELWVITSGNLPVEPLRSRKDVIYKQWSREQELELLKKHFEGFDEILGDGYEPRVELDETIMSVLELDKESQEAILSNIYTDLLMELVELKEIVDG
jgi:hypothetical protein